MNHDTAFKANAIGPRNLAQAATKTGARLVHVSTDYVFSGRENGGIPQDEATIPGPISAYGSTKLMGEKYVEQFCHRHFIVRTAWLYSYYGKNFVKTIVNAGRKFGKLEVVNDQCGNPTNAVDLAHEILQLCVTHEYGLYHCTGEGICSWYDFASEIIRLSGVDATVAPVSYTHLAIAEQGADFVYTDEATFEGKVENVVLYHFKPDFMLDNLRSNNYICHLTLFSRRLMDAAGGPERMEYNLSLIHISCSGRSGGGRAAAGGQSQSSNGQAGSSEKAAARNLFHIQTLLFMCISFAVLCCDAIHRKIRERV